MDLARHGGQLLLETLQIEAPVSSVEGEGHEVALEADLEDLFVVVPVEVRQDQGVPRGEEELRRPC